MMFLDPMSGDRTRSQRGETLLESLLAIMILSIVSIAVLSGVRTAMKASALHHEISVAETLLRSSAEDLQNPDRPYIPLAGCPGHDTYTGLPTQHRFSPITATVDFWDPSGNPNTRSQSSPGNGAPGPSRGSRGYGSSSANPAAGDDGPVVQTITFGTAGTCPSEDLGLQRITLRLTTPSGHLQTLTVMKRQP